MANVYSTNEKYVSYPHLNTSIEQSAPSSYVQTIDRRNTVPVAAATYANLNHGGPNTTAHSHHRIQYVSEPSYNYRAAPIPVGRSVVDIHRQPTTTTTATTTFMPSLSTTNGNHSAMSGSDPRCSAASTFMPSLSTTNGNHSTMSGSDPRCNAANNNFNNWNNDGANNNVRNCSRASHQVIEIRNEASFPGADLLLGKINLINAPTCTIRSSQWPSLTIFGTATPVQQSTIQMSRMSSSDTTSNISNESTMRNHMISVPACNVMRNAGNCVNNSYIGTSDIGAPSSISAHISQAAKNPGDDTGYSYSSKALVVKETNMKDERSVLSGPKMSSIVTRNGRYLPTHAMKFPELLFTIIYDAMKNDEEKIVSFLPHGRAFIVHNISTFEEDIMPRYFSHRVWKTFRR